MRIMKSFIIGLFLLIYTNAYAEYSQMQKRIDEKEKLRKEDQPYSFPRFKDHKKEQNDKNTKNDKPREDSASKKSPDSVKSH